MAIAAALSGTVPTYADAAGLGRLTVQSALGQPLRAEVEVTSLHREEAGSLSARLAPADAFRQAGLDFNPALSSLRFAVEQRPGGNAVVRITSAQPINEPFVDLLVELNWSAGKFVREYTFLLDPPELRIGRETVVAGGPSAQAAAPIVAPAVASRAAAAPTSPQAAAAPAASATAAPAAPAARAEAAPAQRAAPAPAPAASSAAPAAGAPGSVEVRSGDTLTNIAARVKPADIAIEQAVMAIYAANPQAFFGTVHQMYAGATLAIPDRATMAAVDAATAQREIRAQARDFNAYRARLASAAREVAPAAAGQSAAGTVGAKVESAAPATSGDQLKLSRSADAAASPGAATGSTAGAAAGAEAQVAREAALREQQERVSALERNVADLQQLVELKNRQLAELQQQVEAARLAGTTASGTVGAAGAAAGAAAAGAAAATDSSATTSATAPDTTAGATTAAPSPSAAGQPGSSGTQAADTAATGAATAGSAGTDTAASPGADGAATPPAASATAEQPAAASTASNAPAQAPAPTASTPPAVPLEEPSALAALMENPLLLPAFAAIALGLGAYGLYAVRRRRKAEEFDDSLSAADAFTANSLFGSTGGQAVDTHNSLFETSARDSGVDVHSTEVDPIAEAEVYIAYGREAQAEEILKEALKKQPERQAIRLKLLEIQAARKDPVAFGVLAQEMYDMAGGQNEEWPKVVTLGLSIDPANPLYTGQGDASASAFDDAAQGDGDRSDGASDRSAAAGLSAAAGAAAAAFGEKFEDGGQSEARRAPGGPFAETVPMDGESAADAGVPPLDFDLDLETSVGRAGSALSGQSGEARAAAESDLERAIEGRFDLPSLDLDLTGAGKTVDRPSAEIASAAGEAAGEDFAASAADDLAADEPPALADLGEFKIDLPSLEGLDTRPAVHDADEPAAIDFGDFDVESDGAQRDDLSSGGLGLAAAETAVEPTVDTSRWQEMATKLDLASAYEEIGDKEGARELLEEVLDGGDIAQQQKARVMLSKIG